MGSLVFTGCKGPAGPPGLDAEGFDTLPPTIQLTNPQPLSTVWDRFTVAAAAVDNVGIASVVFTVDGSPWVGGHRLMATQPPFTFEVNAASLARGWHLVNARAFDPAGNVTDSPVIPIRLEFSRDLSDTLVTLMYHNGVPATEWNLPDSSGSLTAYWVRFNPAKSCDLIGIALNLGGVLSDSARAEIGVWTGTGAPTTQKAQLLLSNHDIDNVITRLEFRLDTLKLSDQKDFFVTLSWNARESRDTLKIAVDDGYPFWDRSGVKGEEGWRSVEESLGVRNNLVMECNLYYSSVADTGSGSRR